jgi:hypothetical protein
VSVEYSTEARHRMKRAKKRPVVSMRVSPVTIRRPDGSVEIQPAYNHRQAVAIVAAGEQIAHRNKKRRS